VTAIVIPTTIMLTMFASRIMGFSINRVSLFALIFSIGILVDDAIVMIENIARHWGMKDDRSRQQAAIRPCRGGQPHDHRHLDGGGRAVADAVRVGADGALYGAHPDQRLGGDGVQLLRRGGDRAWLMIRFARGALAHGPWLRMAASWARSMPAMPPA
jgi:hypothetical protein